MLVVITYDIEKDRIRSRLAKKLKDFGPRVQKSVFEADVNQEELQKIQEFLGQVKLEKDDSIRLYQVCEACLKKIVIWGKGMVSKDQDYYIA